MYDKVKSTSKMPINEDMRSHACVPAFSLEDVAQLDERAIVALSLPVSNLGENKPQRADASRSKIEISETYSFQQASPFGRFQLSRRTD